MSSDKANPFASSTLDQYLHLYGWEFKKVSDRQWVTGFHGKSKSFHVGIEMTDTWIQFKVSPLLFITQDWHHWPEVLQYLLQLNEITHLAKLSLDDNGLVNLSIQTLAEEFSYRKFELNLGILGYYADVLHDELVSFLREVGGSNPSPNGYLS